MSIDRRQFIQGVLAAGVAAVSIGAVGTQTAQGAAPAGRALGSTESWLLSTGRRALGCSLRTETADVRGGAGYLLRPTEPALDAERGGGG